MTPATAVVFAMGERGHFKRMLPVIDGLVRAGVTTHVFTDVAFREDTARAGGRFVDLFADHTVADADAMSIPVPCRFVSFAGHFGDDVVKAATALRPSLVVHDTFAVIGLVVANHLGVPRVNVCAGHNLAPGPTVHALRQDPRVRIADACHDAVWKLQQRHGLPDASPFSYVTGVSADLNLYCEPPQFLKPEERASFEPLAFFGSLWLDPVSDGEGAVLTYRGDSALRQRVYASFGTIIWRYYEEAACAALGALVDLVAGRDDVEAVISLGGTRSPSGADRWPSPNVHVEPYVDQWRLLRDSSVYLTHQGLNSTHEAIYCGVPMIAYPFFADQPGLAARCEELGLGVPLVKTLRGPVTPDDVRLALDRVASSQVTMSERLAEAREWELETIRRRPAVIARMVALAS